MAGASIFVHGAIVPVIRSPQTALVSSIQGFRPKAEKN